MNEAEAEANWHLRGTIEALKGIGAHLKEAKELAEAEWKDDQDGVNAVFHRTRNRQKEAV
jgi:hypothetical protein